MEPRRNTTLFQEIGETPTVDIYYYEWTGPGNEKKSNADAMADVERRELIDEGMGSSTPRQFRRTSTLPSVLRPQFKWSIFATSLSAAREMMP